MTAIYSKHNHLTSTPFFMVIRPSRVHAGFCLLWCGEDRHDAPHGHPQVFASRAEAVEAFPDWEEEIMTS